MKLELTGKTYGQITVIGKGTKPRSWTGHCACSPEISREFNGSRLSKGFITSCGCLRSTHGHTSGKTRSPTYISWQNMIQRCKALQSTDSEGNVTRPRKHDARWVSFKAFHQDMGDRPIGTTLDRIDTFGNYSKDNCRWASRLTQDYNRKNTKFYYADPETKLVGGSALDWADLYTRSTGTTMTVAEFIFILRFMSPEQFWCALSPLSTYAQLKRRHEQDKKDKWNEKWTAPGGLVDEDLGYDDTGYVPDDAELEAQQENIAREVFRRNPVIADD